MKKVFITGISGFAGSHLAQYLLSKKEYALSGTYLMEESLRNLAGTEGKIKLVKLDLRNQEKVFKIVNRLKPQMLFHLAALPAVGESFARPLETLVNNIAAQLSILEAVRRAKLRNCRILVVSSADVYGKVAKRDIPIDENTPFNPTSAYAVSKIAQDYLALQYFTSYKLPIIRTRPFNHIGPRQSTGFVVADFAKKIAEIEKGKREPVLRVGNLKSTRDFTDVRDIVRAYLLLIEKGKIGDVYNIGSQVSYKIADILAMLISFSKVEIKVKTDRQLFRPEDAAQRLCDSSKLTKLTGWRPKIPMAKTLKETLDYWRNMV